MTPGPYTHRVLYGDTDQMGVVKVQGDPLARALGHTVHACVNRDGRPTRAPEWLMSALAPAASLRKTLDLTPHPQA